MVSYVVTGANRGIGLRFIRALSSVPENVVFALVRNVPRSEDLLKLQTERNNIHILPADLTDVESLKAAARSVSEFTDGTLDVLINNAARMFPERGMNSIDSYAEGEEHLLEKDFLDDFRTNVVGVIHVINAFLPLLRKTSTKSLAKVIDISSFMADVDFTLTGEMTYLVPYSVSKSGLNMACAKFAASNKGKNIVFLNISPGFVNTFQGTPTSEEAEGVRKMIAALQKFNPSWGGNLHTPEESVELMLKIIKNATLKDTGGFVSQYGDHQWM